MIYKKIDYGDKYVIYKDGRIQTIKTNRISKHLNNGNYLYVNLSYNKKTKNFYVHRLLAIAFIPNPENKPCVDHINRNKLDNRLENLRWVTRTENNINQSVKKNNKLGEKYIHINNRGRYRINLVKIKIDKKSQIHMSYPEIPIILISNHWKI